MGKGNIEKNIWPSERKWHMDDPQLSRVNEFV
jgi:hypothetical protein